jgi:phosphate transport system substrate-binding protein
MLIKTKMKKSTIFKTFAILIITFIVIKCNSKVEKETILTGKADVSIDESLLPIMEEQKQIFESKYKATINLVPSSEAEIIQALLKDSIQIAVVTQKLSIADSLRIVKLKKHPRQTPFASDAIALIANKKGNDTLISVQEIIDFMQKKSSTKIKGLVFDNPNSSSVRYMNDLAGLKTTPEKNIFSFKTTREVIKYVSENNGMIGVVGLNWLQQNDVDVKNISLLSVKSLKNDAYIYPSQNNIADKSYPLARDLYIINCQGYDGLGMGFASFITGEIGQRIILKSGLLPFRMPGRNIVIRKNIEKENK